MANTKPRRYTQLHNKAKAVNAFARYLKRTARTMQGRSLARIERELRSSIQTIGYQADPDYYVGTTSVRWDAGREALCRWNPTGGFWILL